jgi:arylsulfatase A-like enzyme
LVVSLVQVACGGGSGPAEAERPRAVVLIGVDTLRADHLGLHGATRPTSPFLDELASEGIVFDRAFATSPWTLPSFASIFTGRLQSGHAAGIRPRTSEDEWNEEQIGPMRQVILDPGVETLAERLSSAGFETIAVAQNPNLDPIFGVDRGFDIYDHVSGTYEDTRRSNAVVDLALEYLDNRQAEEFFLFLHFWDPHMQYDAPEPYGGMFTDGLEGGFTLPVAQDPQPLRRDASSLSPERKAFMVAAYDEEIRFVDSQFERLVTGLRERGLWDRSLVIFAADHGEELFDHGGFEHGHTLYNELLHVPLIFWGPGIAARRSAVPVSIADITPTILDALGMETSQEIFGISLWPHVVAEEEISERLIAAEGTAYGPELKAGIFWPYKIIVNTRRDRMWLFDLESDFAERKASESRQALAASLRERLELRLLASSQGVTYHETELDPELLRQLRSLGYIR